MVLDIFESRSGRVELINIAEFVVELGVWNLKEKKSTSSAIDISGVWRSKFHEVVDFLTVTYLDFHTIAIKVTCHRPNFKISASWFPIRTLIISRCQNYKSWT